MTEFNQEFCTRTHDEVNRRIGSMEARIQHNEDSFAQNLTRIYDEIKDVNGKVTEANKRPGWAVLAIITLLTSLSVGLFIVLVK